MIIKLLTLDKEVFSQSFQERIELHGKDSNKKNWGVN